MSATTCGHGFPSPLSCVDCMNDEGVGAPPAERPTIEAVTVAKYRTECGACEDPVELGDPIALLSDGQWIHADPCSRRYAAA